MAEDYDVMLRSPDFKAGKAAHELGASIDDLINTGPAELDLVFDLIIAAQVGMTNLIVRHLRWRAEKNRKLDINERLCQVRH